MTNINLKRVKKVELFQKKLREKALKNGVKMLSPETVYLSPDTKFGKDIVIEPFVVIGQNVKIGNNVIIKSFTHIEGAKIENKVIIGPYSRIREGTKLKAGSKIGNFVETKKSTIGKNSKVNHLTYLGDTDLGNHSNVGAGTITCNYDGVKKNKTKIHNNVFIGSNTSLVAPLVIEKNSFIGAGSVITKKVLGNSLALSRAKQIGIKNFKRKK